MNIASVRRFMRVRAPGVATTQKYAIFQSWPNRARYSCRGSIQCGVMGHTTILSTQGVLQEQLHIWDRWILAMLIFNFYYLV